MTGQRGQSGFTLIELLAASVISAFIAMIAVVSVKSVTNGRERIEQYAQASDDLRYAIEIIRKDLLNIYREADPSQRSFQGRPLLLGELEVPYSMLRFQTVSRTPVRLMQPEGDVYEVDYFVSENEEDPTEPLKLMRRCQPNVYNARRRGGMLSILYESVRSFDVLFYDARQQEWVESWSAKKTRLPDMIKIKLTGTTPDGRHVLARSAIVDFWRWPKAPKQSSSSSSGGRTGGNQTGGGGGRPGGNVGGDVGGAPRSGNSGGRGGTVNNRPGGGRGNRGGGNPGNRPGNNGRGGGGGRRGR